MHHVEFRLCPSSAAPFLSPTATLHSHAPPDLLHPPPDLPPPTPRASLHPPLQRTRPEPAKRPRCCQLGSVSVFFVHQVERGSTGGGGQAGLPQLIRHHESTWEKRRHLAWREVAEVAAEGVDDKEGPEWWYRGPGAHRERLNGALCSFG